MDGFKNSHDSHVVENVIGDGATLIRTASGLGTPFAFEMATCIRLRNHFFGLKTDRCNVRMITPATGRFMRIARDELCGPDGLPTGFAQSNAVAFDGVIAASGLSNSDIVEHYVERKFAPGTFLIIDGIERLIGAKATPGRVIELCDMLVNTCAQKGFPLAVIMDAHADDGEHYRRLLSIFNVHVSVRGDGDRGEWRVDQSIIGLKRIGGAFKTRNVRVGLRPNGAQITANVIDPASCKPKTSLRWVAEPNALIAHTAQ